MASPISKSSLVRVLHAIGQSITCTAMIIKLRAWRLARFSFVLSRYHILEISGSEGKLSPL